MLPKKHIHISFQELIFVLLLAAGGVLLAFHSGGFVLNLQTIGFTVVSTVERQVSLLGKGFINVFTAVGRLAKLQKDYDALVEKLEKYEEMRRSNTEIRKENEYLKEQLGFVKKIAQENFPASIIARSSDNLYAYLTVDKGASAGVRKNMAVIAHQNGNTGLVGRVIQVGHNTSIVMPIYNINCIVSARLQNSRDLGLVYGGGDDESTLTMRYVRKRANPDFHYGDLIVTSGENNNYQENVTIGSVGKISVLEYNSSLEIEITPIIDFSRLENVVIVNVNSVVIDTKEDEG